MYKALIADDEEIIRRGIARFLQKDSEIEVVAQAEDGETAFELAARFLPDLLFVDINMPFLSGLEFIEKLGGILKDSVIIVITGYDDFAYAQRALRLGVFDYLLKPMMEEVFYKALEKAKEKLNQRHRQVKYLEWARVILEKNKASLTNEFLEAWLDGHYSESEVEERTHYLGLEIPQHFGVTVVQLSGGDSRAVAGDEWDDDLLFYAAENIAQEVFQPLSPVSTCKNSGGDLIVISSGGPEEQWHATGMRLKELLRQYLPVVEAGLVQCAGTGSQSLPGIYDRALAEARGLRECPQMIQDVKKCMEEQFACPEFSLTDAAEYVHLSPQHLSRVFRHETGVTFMDYLTRLRIRRAIELLGDSSMKMYEIAERVGYSTQHYFSSAFKKVLGVSPMEYRKNSK